MFREQAIDEFNSKLNGEVILNSALNKRLIAVMLLSLVLVFSFFNFIKINESNVVSGWFYFDEKNILSAQILIDPKYLDDFYFGKKIEVYLPDFQDAVILKIVSIEKKLIVDESKKIKVKVLAKLLDSQILIKDNSFQLNEGVVFTVVVNGEKITLFSWLGQHFSGRVNG